MKYTNLVPVECYEELELFDGKKIDFPEYLIEAKTIFDGIVSKGKRVYFNDRSFVYNDQFKLFFVPIPDEKNTNELRKN